MKERIGICNETLYIYTQIHNHCTLSQSHELQIRVGMAAVNADAYVIIRNASFIPVHEHADRRPDLNRPDFINI